MRKTVLDVVTATSSCLTRAASRGLSTFPPVAAVQKTKAIAGQEVWLLPGSLKQEQTASQKPIYRACAPTVPLFVPYNRVFISEQMLEIIVRMLEISYRTAGLALGCVDIQTITT